MVVAAARGSDRSRLSLSCSLVARLDIHSVVPGVTELPVYAVVDTPGICTGLAQRPQGPGLWDDQLVVADSRCGVLLLGRTGQ